ncbi:glycoside hydrolase family 5 protein [Apiospora arundinis]|uniref:Glycoside hydrolase family 5 protein n=1 Tax=Apiospora arundinis TaxID=335852 RepID=A0ABR2HLA3_9PEZI
MRWTLPDLASRLAVLHFVLWPGTTVLAVSLFSSEPASAPGFAGTAADITPRAALSSPWPNGPFATSDRWMTDASGNIVTYAGVNWPGHIDVMIPEGLQYQSVASLVSKVKSLGMNAIRLTYAIEMIDQIVDNGNKDIPISKAFADALGQENGTAVLQKVLKNNQGLFDEDTTRLQVFDAVAAECAKQQIYVHLDNHVSKAGWCCTPLDGNSWWGDKYFSTANWTRGLAYMADHGKKWPNLMSMALRNELRGPFLSGGRPESYNWDTWYKRMREGADAVHGTNSNVLIFLSGLNSDKDLGPVVQQDETLSGGSSKFSRSDFKGYGDDKLVLELHYYDILRGSPPRDCAQVNGELDDAGFAALGNASSTNRFPVLMTEFGFAQDPTTWNMTIHRCTEQFLANRQAGWTIWALGGSYYTREGTADYDEPWGLLNHDWSDWRSPEHVRNGLLPLVKASLAASGGPAPPPPVKSSPSHEGEKKSGGVQQRQVTFLSLSGGLSVVLFCFWAAMTHGVITLCL